jgi:hypothetical protein
MSFLRRMLLLTTGEPIFLVAFALRFTESEKDRTAESFHSPSGITRRYGTSLFLTS